MTGGLAVAAAPASGTIVSIPTRRYPTAGTLLRWRVRARSLVLAAAFALAGAGPAQAIVGGRPAPPGQWPWMAALLNGSTPDPTSAQYCGGAVISPRRVLTATHCVIGISPNEVSVLVGQTRLSAADGRRLAVRAINIYPGYLDRRQPSLDAAVITLAADAGVPPLALAPPGDEGAWAPARQAWALGWGAINARPSPGKHTFFADRLRQLPVPLQGDDACENVYGVGFVDLPYRADWLLCAGTADGSTGTCSGDSGGPLVVGEPGAWTSVGIVIGGDGCAARGYYDLYTRVDRISTFALGPLQLARTATRAPRGGRAGRHRGVGSSFLAPASRHLREIADHRVRELVSTSSG